ncbi:MAG: S8 family serine peptidase [Myxococcota bacterium]|nr:S8 family serine peptidase [Myxococcota bacterium]
MTKPSLPWALLGLLLILIPSTVHGAHWTGKRVVHDGADPDRAHPLHAVPGAFTITWEPGIEEHWSEGDKPLPAPRELTVGPWTLRRVGALGAPRFHTDRYQLDSEAPPDQVAQALARLPDVKLAAPLFDLSEEAAGPWRAATPRILVQLTDRSEETEFFRLAEELELSVLGRRGAAPNQWRLEVHRGAKRDPVEAAMQLHASPATRWAQVNWIQQRASRLLPDDPLFPEQWHLDNTGQSGGLPGQDVNAVEAWDIALGDPDIVVAIMDSGVDLDHPDLKGVIVPGYDFVNGDSNPSPGGSSHGTSVAGLAAAPAQGIGVVGTCPGCSIMPLRMLGTSDETEAEALDFAATEGADVINNSWGPQDGTGIETPIPAVMATAIDNAITFGRDGLGTVVLWAAGNGHPADTCDLDGFVAYASTLAIGASTDEGERGPYSERCPELDLVAPSGGGNAALSTTNIDGYTSSFGGTSAAAPVATGVAALLLSGSPDLPWSSVREVLRQTAEKIDPGDADYDSNGHSLSYGYGQVDALAALSAEIAFVSVAAAAASCSSELPVTVHLSSPTGQGSLDLLVSSESEAIPEVLGLALTPSGTFEGTVTLSPDPAAPGDGLLSVSHGDTVLIESTAAQDSVTVPVDCESPEILDPRIQELHSWGALIAWETNEEASSVLQWGPDETERAEDTSFETEHLLWALDLTPCADYSASLSATDRQDNSTILEQALTWTAPGNPADLPDDAPVGADPCDPSTWNGSGDDDDSASGGLVGETACQCTASSAPRSGGRSILLLCLIVGVARARRTGASRRTATPEPGSV